MMAKNFKFDVSIVIPNWNGRVLLEKYLPEVIKASRESKNRIKEIIVVDDFSNDDSVKYLKKSFADKIRLIKHTKNRGFSAAVNTGVRMSKGKLVCLLNTDVSPSKNFLSKVVNIFSDSKVFAVSLHEEGFGAAKAEFRNGFLEHSGLTENTKTLETFWANGGSGVFRRSIWMKLKGFDEELFSPFYWEDMDICYRAQKRGYLILWEPKAKVKHKHESIINERNFKRKDLDLIKERNQLLFIWKNITSRQLFRRHIYGLIKRIVRHPGYFLVVYAALKKFKKVRQLRRIEIKEAKVADEAIFARFQK